METLDHMLQTYWDQGIVAVGRILVYALYVENAVTESLRKHYVDGGICTHSEFIESLHGKFRSFKSKNEEYVRIRGPRLKRELNWCRKLRNKFAHYSIDTSSGWESVFNSKKVRFKDVWKNNSMIVSDKQFNQKSKRLRLLIPKI
jgi:hypothetical protein